MILAVKDIKIDRDGNLRCWNCGQMALTEKRTFRAKAVGGVAGFATLGLVGAAAPLLTKKKLKCQVCGEYNDTGSAKPFAAPSNRKWRERMEQSGELRRLTGQPNSELAPSKQPAQKYVPPPNTHEIVAANLRQPPRTGRLGMDGVLKPPPKLEDEPSRRDDDFGRAFGIPAYSTPAKKPQPKPHAGDADSIVGALVLVVIIAIVVAILVAVI